MKTIFIVVCVGKKQNYNSHTTVGVYTNSQMAEQIVYWLNRYEPYFFYLLEEEFCA